MPGNCRPRCPSRYDRNRCRHMGQALPEGHRYHGYHIAGTSSREHRLPHRHYVDADLNFFVLPDGIYIDWTRKSPTVGWEAPVLDPFIRKTGIDPRKSPKSEWVKEWLAHQAGFVTLFMRELRSALDEVARETGRRIPVAAQIKGGWRLGKRTPECFMDGIDIATWAGEGLVDIVAPGENLFHAPVNLDHFHQLIAGTDCQLWGCIHQRARECYPFQNLGSPDNAGIEARVDPWIAMRTAADLYNQDAKGLFLWESGELPTVPARWNILKNLGDRKRLKNMFGPPIGFRDGRHRFEQLRLES